MPIVKVVHNKVDPVVEISSDELRERVANGDGICVACGEWREGNVPPNADEHTCDSCHESRVFGAKRAARVGYISVEEG